MNARDINNSEEDNGNQSRINAAGLINSTLEKLWLQCYSAMASGDYIQWNVKLDSIWAILGGDEPEDGDVEKAINNLDMKIYETGYLGKSQKGGFVKEVNPKRSLQYQLLKKKSLFLRRLQNKQGKGTAYHSEDDYDFD